MPAVDLAAEFEHVWLGRRGIGAWADLFPQVPGVGWLWLEHVLRSETLPIYLSWQEDRAA